TLDVYSHLLPGMQKEAAERMDGALRRTTGFVCKSVSKPPLCHPRGLHEPTNSCILVPGGPVRTARAEVAQLVEQRTENPCVASSTLALGTPPCSAAGRGPTPT